MQTVKFYKVQKLKDGSQGLVVAAVECCKSITAALGPNWKKVITVPRAEGVMHRLGWRRRSELTPTERRLIPAGGLAGVKSVSRLKARLEMQ